MRKKSQNEKKGTLVLISAPSGGGKNAVIRALLHRFHDATQLVTTTTRKRRKGEKEGVDYHFMSRRTFEAHIAKGAFVEYNEYVGNLYGTQWKDFNDTLKKYPIVFSQAEVNGKRTLDRMGVAHISIFLLPERMEILQRRIEQRGDVADKSIAERLAIAQDEIRASKDYDFRILNKDGHMEETINTVVAYLAQKRGLAARLP